MPKAGLAPDKDRVVLDFGGLRRDLIFEPWVGMRFAEYADRAADACEQWVKAGGSRQVITGEPVDVRVQSWDGRINVRFGKAYDRLAVPYEVMRWIADQVRCKVTEARFRVHLAVGTINAVNSGSVSC
jgi:hypothetical protein